MDESSGPITDIRQAKNLFAITYPKDKKIERISDTPEALELANRMFLAGQEMSKAKDKVQNVFMSFMFGRPDPKAIMKFGRKELTDDVRERFQIGETTVEEEYAGFGAGIHSSLSLRHKHEFGGLYRED